MPISQLSLSSSKYRSPIVIVILRTLVVLLSMASLSSIANSGVS
jgi:hypothetical protein